MVDRPFSRNVRRLRAELGFSKSAFARAVGVSPTCVWNWEKGNTEPRPEALVLVAKVLQTSPDALLGRMRPSHPPEVGSTGEAASQVTLVQEIEAARRRIAQLAGIEVDRVRVTLEYA